MNHQIKTVLLLGLISGLFLAIGYLVGGESGMTFALVVSLVMNVGAYWFSDKIVLAMHRVQPIGPGHPSGVYELVAELSQEASLPIPKIYLVPERAPNAFATGRNPEHAAMAVTGGILEVLNSRELRAVLAHELSHIKNRDTLVSTVVASIASAIMYLAHMLQWIGFYGGGRSREGEGSRMNPLALLGTIILAPIVATIIQLSVSRTREYFADESGAQLASDPEGLASALEKIADPAYRRVYQRDPAMQPAFAHLYIVNHFSGESLMTLFSTHPPVQERIRRLLLMRVS